MGLMNCIRGFWLIIIRDRKFEMHLCIYSSNESWYYYFDLFLAGFNTSLLYS
jgi:hypothetical protein